MAVSKARRIGIAGLGYIAAWLIAGAAVWLKNLGISEADQLASSGMFAFGDSVLFLAVVSIFSAPPTIYLLTLLPSTSRFWQITSAASLVLALTAIIELLWFLPLDNKRSPLALLQMLAPLRLCIAPFFVLLFIPGIFLSVARNRRRFLIACGVEIVTGGFALLVFLFHIIFARR